MKAGIKLMKGYRFLESGETIREGDMVYKDGGWGLVKTWGGYWQAREYHVMARKKEKARD